MTSPADDTPASNAAQSPAPHAAATTEAAAAPDSPAGRTEPSPSRPARWTREALDGAGRLLSTAANDEIVRTMIGAKARNNVAATVFGGTILGAIAARVATRSVPGALLVGGAMLAKAVYDQRKQKGTEPERPPKF